MFLSPEADQREVFALVGLPCVRSLFSGQNACIFAYGFTGAGKTHTMIGEKGGQSATRRDGLIPSIATEVFRRIGEDEDSVLQVGADVVAGYRVEASYVEIYKGNI